MVHTYAHVVNGRVVETLVTSVALGELFPAAMPWVDITALSPQPGVGWSYTGSAFVAPAPVAVPAPRLSSLEFMALLAPAEQTAIATAAQSNASVLVWLLKISGATYVDLGDAATIAGVNAMVSAGLLTAARATAILSNTPVAAS